MTEAEEIKRLMREAFAKAFQEQIAKLYSVYLTNTSGDSNSEQRGYTRKGIDRAIEAYKVALAAVEAWEGA